MPVPPHLAELGRIIAARSRPDLSTSIPGLRLSKVDAVEPDHSLTEPLLVVMVRGRKRLLLHDRVFDYGPGDCLVVTAELPVTGEFLDISRHSPSLALGLELRPAAIASLLIGTHLPPPPRHTAGLPAIATGPAGPELLDAFVRLLRLLDRPRDADVLAPLVEREILWRLLTGPHGAAVRQIGTSGSALTHVGRAIGWMRRHYAEPLRIDHLARLAAMSPSTFHRQFRAVTAMSPLQFQKRIRLQEARTLLVAHPGDVAGVGHRVGYGSATQFNREYRRMFGAPPGRDAALVRGGGSTDAARRLP